MPSIIHRIGAAGSRGVSRARQFQQAIIQALTDLLNFPFSDAVVTRNDQDLLRQFFRHWAISTVTVIASGDLGNIIERFRGINLSPVQIGREEFYIVPRREE